MRRLAFLVAILPLWQVFPEPEGCPMRFAPLHLWLDSGQVPLAAYQVSLAVQEGDVAIVGLEGGEHPAFREAPYYDPAALGGGRIVVAAFQTGGALPAGRTRVATLHLRIRGQAKPVYKLAIETAASAEGHEIPVVASLEEGVPR